MGHQLPRAAVAAAVALAGVACGGGDDAGELPPVLDNAREVARAAAPSTSVRATVVREAAADELPLPDPSEFEGANRVVNLWVGADRETRPVDVWGRRTFTNGPILLAENIAFGSASDYFAAPPGYDLVIVGSGAGPDGVELAGLFNAVEGEQITTVYTNDDEFGAVWAPNLFEADLDGRSATAAPPKPGMGLVYLYAPNTRSFGDSLTASVGGDSYYVGDGAGACRPQRVESEGFQANILGGTQNVQLDLPPGPSAISLHPWLSPEECGQRPVLEFVVDVPADGAIMALVYSADGDTLDVLQLPIG